MSFIRSGRPWSVIVLLGLAAMGLGLAYQFVVAVDVVALGDPAASAAAVMLSFSGGVMAILGAILWFAAGGGERNDEA